MGVTLLLLGNYNHPALEFVHKKRVNSCRKSIPIKNSTLLSLLQGSIWNFLVSSCDQVCVGQSARRQCLLSWAFGVFSLVPNRITEIPNAFAAYSNPVDTLLTPERLPLISSFQSFKTEMQWKSQNFICCWGFFSMSRRGCREFACLLWANFLPTHRSNWYSVLEHNCSKYEVNFLEYDIYSLGWDQLCLEILQIRS